MIIRRYSDDDLESMVALFTNTVRRVNLGDYSPDQVVAWAPQPPDLDHWRRRVTGLTIWVAETDKQMTGFCGLRADGCLDLLYVDHRFQRQGVARGLYQQMEKEARLGGLRRLQTEASVTARPFFERMGFVVIRDQQVEYRGVRFRNFAMEKHLLIT
jgi:putative acetyltransferase